MPPSGYLWVATTRSALEAAIAEVQAQAAGIVTPNRAELIRQAVELNSALNSAK